MLMHWDCAICLICMNGTSALPTSLAPSTLSLPFSLEILSSTRNLNNQPNLHLLSPTQLRQHNRKHVFRLLPTRRILQSSMQFP
mmetsp:Transcript_47333/g.111442  ORF Transcript_47333/g.111442 Transcript_47333/m.111442 type:complete len:84 (-) Transcript_47333:309-560(-)